MSTKKDEKTFPVKLLKNYRPASENFMIEGTNAAGEPELRAPEPGEAEKVMAGTTIHLPIDEARAVIDKKIGDRCDPIA